MYVCMDIHNVYMFENTKHFENFGSGRYFWIAVEAKKCRCGLLGRHWPRHWENRGRRVVELPSCPVSRSRAIFSSDFEWNVEKCAETMIKLTEKTDCCRFRSNLHLLTGWSMVNKSVYDLPVTQTKQVPCVMLVPGIGVLCRKQWLQMKKKLGTRCSFSWR